LAVFVGPKILAAMPSIDPLMVIFGVFLLLAALQQLGFKQDSGNEVKGGRAANLRRKSGQEQQEQEAEQAAGGSVERLLSDAQRSLDQNNYSRAAELATKAVDKDPESAQAWELLAAAQKWQGLRKEAAETVRKALEVYEVDSPALRALAKELESTSSPAGDAKASAEKGDDFLAKRQYDLAWECYSRALEIFNCDGDLGKVADGDRDFFLQLTRGHATCAQQLQDWGPCRRSATVLLDADPNDQQALLQRAASNEAMEKFKEALDDARTLLVLDPKNKAANRIMNNCQQALRS